MKKINFKPYFEKANSLKLTPFEISYSSSRTTTVSTFNGKVEAQEIGNNSSLTAKGLFAGKLGIYSLDSISKNSVDELVDGVFEASKYGKEEVKEHFYKNNGAKYKKVKINYNDFEEATLISLRKIALELDALVSKKDKRITKIETAINMEESFFQKENDLGLKYSNKSHGFSGSISIVAEQDGEPRSSYIVFKSFKSLDELKANALKKIDELVSSSVDFFKSGPIASKTYRAVLSPSVVVSLLSFYVEQLSAKSVIEHLSIFENKLNEQICSKKLTITHTPFKPSFSASSIDAEGHPTSEFKVIKNGVLLNYFHSLETSLKMKVEDNGCGSGNGNASPISLTVKEGKKTVEDGFKTIKNGVYITDVSGLNSGINSQTLDFSLPCQGYQVKDGVKSNATSMIIISGNLKDLFFNIKEVFNDVEEHGGIFSPSCSVSKIAVSGK